jgi:hypothetical protein
LNGDYRSAMRPFVTVICDFSDASIRVKGRTLHRTWSAESGHTRVARCFIGSVGGHQSPYQGWQRTRSPHALSD